LQEHVQSLNRELLALKRAPDGPDRAERLKQLFRTAHSLKGAARSVNARLIEDACHHLEDILAAQRDNPRGPGSNFFSLLFAAAEAIEEAGQRLREQQDLTGSPLVGLVAKLATAVPRGSKPDAPAPDDKVTRWQGDKVKEEEGPG